MKTIKDLDVWDKKVILRCDLNVSIKDGKISSDERIIASLETIKYLINSNCKLIIMSHLGKVKTEEDKKNNSLKVVYERLKELLPDINIYFCPETRGKVLEDYAQKLQNGEILLMENTRFEDLDNKKESNNDLQLAKYWAGLGEVFIDDAFGMTHRRHASNNGIKKFLPSGVGFLIAKELEMLDSLMNPEKPFVVIMGGAKVEDKSLLIESIIKRTDYLLLGGGIASTFLAANHNVGKSLVSKEYISEAKKLLTIYKERIILPIDVIVKNNEDIHIKNITELNDDDIIYDIGPHTIKEYEQYINKAKTIFMNGTAGLYEDKNFEQGTKSILAFCSKSTAKVILGGGDALASAAHFNIKDFYHLSTGGGATLDYISTGKLACMEED